MSTVSQIRNAYQALDVDSLNNIRIRLMVDRDIMRDKLGPKTIGFNYAAIASRKKINGKTLRIGLIENILDSRDPKVL